MSSIQERVVAQNPWWREPGAVHRDPLLRALAGSPFVRTADPLEGIRTDEPAVITLRGPRRVGKSTSLKHMARDAVEQGRADRTLYYSFDLEEAPDALLDVYREAQRIQAGRSEGPWLILFDEITSIPEWQSAVKFLRDQTEAARDCFILTGSSARDLKRTGEFLPGRRGRIDRPDRLLLPLSFREFVEAAGFEPEPAGRVGLGRLVDGDLPDMGRWPLHRDRLNGLFEDYMQVGGFPEAVVDYLDEGTVRDASIRMLWEICMGEVTRWGRDRITAMKALERVVLSLGGPVSWTRLAEEMEVSSAVTAREYAELLADVFILLHLYQWDLARGTFSSRRQKKLYAADPLFLAIPSRIHPGSAQPERSALAENVVALTLFRYLDEGSVESFGVPNALFYWRSKSQNEIDFLARPRSDAVPIEVTYGRRVRKGKTEEGMIKRFGKGLILTRDHLGMDGKVPHIPVSLFCYVLG